VLYLIYNEQASSKAVPVTANHVINRIPALKFYRGFTATIAGMIPYAGVNFLCWGYLRANCLPDGAKPTAVTDFTFGAMSGAAAQTVSYPFEVIRRRMQVGGITKPDRWLRWSETVRAIWQSGGWKGFYVGLSIGYLKVVPMTAVSFAVWQGTKRLLGV
jgi:solute carrier family 25 protein 16